MFVPMTSLITITFSLCRQQMMQLFSQIFHENISGIQENVHSTSNISAFFHLFSPKNNFSAILHSLTEFPFPR